MAATLSCEVVCCLSDCRLQEKHARERLRDHLKMIASLQTDLMEVRKRLLSTQGKIRATQDRKQKLLKSASTSRLVFRNSVCVCV